MMPFQMMNVVGSYFVLSAQSASGDAWQARPFGVIPCVPHARRRKYTAFFQIPAIFSGNLLYLPISKIWMK